MYNSTFYFLKYMHPKKRGTQLTKIPGLSTKFSQQKRKKLPACMTSIHIKIDITHVTCFLYINSNRPKVSSLPAKTKELACCSRLSLSEPNQGDIKGYHTPPPPKKKRISTHICTHTHTNKRTYSGSL